MNSTNTREFTEDEKGFLVNLLDNSPSGFKRLKKVFENFAVIWAASLLVLVLVWVVLVWLVNFFVVFDYGFKSDHSIKVIIFFSLITGLYSLFSTIMWAKNWTDLRPAIRSDIEGGLVVDKTYEVSEVKRFQELEHGGLIYFLRMNDNKVLTLYDYESVGLQMQSSNPLQSNFKPCDKLRIVKAPNTGYFISQEFSGEKLPLSEPIDLSSSPDKWPEGDSWCEIPWNELESRLSI